MLICVLSVFCRGRGYGGRFAVSSRLEVHHSEGEGWQLFETNNVITTSIQTMLAL